MPTGRIYALAFACVGLLGLNGAGASAQLPLLTIEGGVGARGSRVDVTLSLSGSAGGAGSVVIDVLFDETVLSIDNPDLACVKSPALQEQVLIASRPSRASELPAGIGRLRLGVLDVTLPFPVASIPDGVLVTCSFDVRPDAPAGDSLLTADPEVLEIATPMAEVICLEDCPVADGSVSIANLDALLLPPCAGDCDGDGRIAIPELIIGTRILLGWETAEACSGLPASSGSVRVSDLVRAVRSALDGCPVTIPSDFLLSMRWHGCPGAPFNCPRYRASVDADGSVMFEGIAGVEHLGVATARVDDSAVEDLARELHRSEILSRPCCECATEFEETDAPSVGVTVRSASTEVGAGFEFGCWESPDRLRIAELVTQVEKSLGLCRWIGRVSFHFRCRE